jgi:predicted metal-dependent phosphoesterase TrpH
MRCDLHVHSIGSGMCNTPVLERVCRESYNDAAEVYARCKLRGMSLVTMTDHDSIEAAETLRRHADFFLSEEVTCRMPSGTEMHLGVYDINESDHLEIQRRRNDFIALMMYLTERKLFFSVNHVFSGLTGPRDAEDFRWFASYVPAFEARNGQMHPATNGAAESLSKRFGKAAIAGSDSHTMAGVGLTYTEVPPARTTGEFFAGLRAGRGRMRGTHGSYLKLTRDIFHIAMGMFREKRWVLPILPLALCVPAFTAAHWLNEIYFCRKWAATLDRDDKIPRTLWDLDARWERV